MLYIPNQDCWLFGGFNWWTSKRFFIHKFIKYYSALGEEKNFRKVTESFYTFSTTPD